MHETDAAMMINSAKLSLNFGWTVTKWILVLQYKTVVVDFSFHI